MGLGEPITLVAIPWLYVVGGALLAKWFTKSKGLTVEQANIISPVLMERIRSQGTLIVGGGISVEEFVAANPDLLNPALYAGGKAPTKEELVNEIYAILAVAKAQGAGSYGTYSPLAQTLQGRR